MACIRNGLITLPRIGVVSLYSYRTEKQNGYIVFCCAELSFISNYLSFQFISITNHFYNVIFE